MGGQTSSTPLFSELKIDVPKVKKIATKIVEAITLAPESQHVVLLKQVPPLLEQAEPKVFSMQLHLRRLFHSSHRELPGEKT